MSDEFAKELLAEEAFEKLLEETKEAVSKGDLAALQKGLSKVDNEKSEEFKHKVLCGACEDGNTEAVRILLRAGAAIVWKHCNDDGCYPVHAATDDVLRVIVEERGSDALNVLDVDLHYNHSAGYPAQATPLLRRALNGGDCSVLLELGADPNYADEDCGFWDRYSEEQVFRPLHAALANNNRKLCRDLLECGAKCDRLALKMALDKDKKMFILLTHLAAKQGTDQRNAVKVLLRELLEEATEAGEVSKVKQITQRNMVDLNERDRDRGTTPLSDAIDHNKKGVAKVLLANGADPFLSVGEWYTDFETAIADGKVKFVRLFLPLWIKAFPTGTDPDGDRPLHILCQVPQASLKVLECVLDDQPADVQEPDELLGLLPVFIAATCDLRLDVIFSLLRRYPDPISSRSNPVPAAAAETEVEDTRDTLGTDEEEPPQKKART